jgi:hypothetical protein
MKSTPACLVLRPPATVCAGDAETLLLAGEQAMRHAGSCLLRCKLLFSSCCALQADNKGAIK